MDDIKAIKEELAAIRNDIDALMAKLGKADDGDTPPLPEPFRIDPNDNASALTPEADRWIRDRRAEGWSWNKLQRITGVSRISLKKREI